MSDLDPMRMLVAANAYHDASRDKLEPWEPAITALDAYDAADAREAVTEEMVEGAAKAACLAQPVPTPLENRSLDIRRIYLREARAALEYAAPLLARRARAPMPVRVTLPMIEAAYHEFMGWSHIHRDMNAMERAIEAALAAAPRDPQQPVQRHMTLGEQRTAMNALRRAGRPADPQPAELVGIGMTDKSAPAPAPPAALRELASTARTLARLSTHYPALAKFAQAVARWAEGQR